EEKKIVPLTFVSRLALEPALPGFMSLTRTVPAAVPSPFHSSDPCMPSSAMKYVVEPTATIADGFDGRVFVLMSRTICGVRDNVMRSSRASRQSDCARLLARAVRPIFRDR